MNARSPQLARFAGKENLSTHLGISSQGRVVLASPGIANGLEHFILDKLLSGLEKGVSDMVEHGLTKHVAKAKDAFTGRFSKNSEASGLTWTLRLRTVFRGWGFSSEVMVVRFLLSC